MLDLFRVISRRILDSLPLPIRASPQPRALAIKRALILPSTPIVRACVIEGRILHQDDKTSFSRASLRSISS